MSNSITGEYVPAEKDEKENKGYSLSLIKDSRNNRRYLSETLEAGKGKDQAIFFHGLQHLDRRPLNIADMDKYIPADSLRANGKTGEGRNVDQLTFKYDHTELWLLSALEKRHRNANQRLPESFIWHVFASLANAVNDCHSKQWKSLHKAKYTENLEDLQLDLLGIGHKVLSLCACSSPVKHNSALEWLWVTEGAAGYSDELQQLIAELVMFHHAAADEEYPKDITELKQKIEQNWQKVKERNGLQEYGGILLLKDEELVPSWVVACLVGLFTAAGFYLAFM
ncbi:hypothetical protein DM02DRAFT_657313 [Periconia macrospinosa]|uniref:Uncharacterized protein n=1 Tax=Periconia macrospinosa TaxID=97972 RepID=A0A2V1DKR4_9PLEO|nr:hypothetical protein DM02DRAFT_657313 [Periconia macrospinosa]